MSSKEIYVSTDVEADGPIPGPNSMLSFGSAAYTGGKELIGTFSANLETLPGATADPKTAEWWAQQPEAWAACQQELEMPETAMRRYVLWLKALPGKPVFVGYPAEHAANTCTPHVGVPSRRYTDRHLHVVTASPKKTDGPQGDEPKP